MHHTRVTELNKYIDFLALKDDWQDITNSDNRYSVFSTWEWLSTWWKYIGNNKRLVLLTAEEKDRIIGIAPLMYSIHQSLGLRIGKIEFIGSPDSDYADFIIAEKNKQCLEAFIKNTKNILKNRFLELTELPENSKSLPALQEVAYSLKITSECPYILLPKSQDLFLKSLSSRLRYDLKKCSKKMEQDGFEAEFVNYSGKEVYLKGMQTFFELHQKRVKSKGLSSAYSEERYRSFALEIANIFSRKGWLGLYILELSGKPVSALFGFKYGRKFYSYLSGIDPAYYQYGVGKLIIAHVIGQCIDNGLVEFDFLRGAEEYKNRWNTGTRQNKQITIVQNGIFGKIEYPLSTNYFYSALRFKSILKNTPNLLSSFINGDIAQKSYPKNPLAFRKNNDLIINIKSVETPDRNKLILKKASTK